ncbi:MAG: beta-ketoacyl synthase N-terminal-like domain-containing protein, partial [Gammaproteobacteria bacterium]
MSQNHYADSHRIAVQSVSLLFANARCIDDLDCYLLGDKKSECERDLSANLADWDRVLGRRFAQRVDNFTRMALYCADQCLKQNRLGLTISDNNCTELGISVGNNYGGWDYVAPQMMDLYHHSMFSINPYVATAWFPAAAQGEIAIRYGIKGCSKTFSCDALSAGVALEYGCDLLEMGNIKYCLTGGVESPTSDIVQKHLMSKHRICDQFPVRRAACFLLLSRETGSAPLCYIAASVRRTVFHAALTECLDRYGKSVDYCMLPATNIDDSHFLQDQLEQELSIVGVCCPQAYV